MQVRSAALSICPDVDLTVEDTDSFASNSYVIGMSIDGGIKIGACQ